MRKHTLLTTLTLTFSLIIWMQFITSQVMADVIAADVNIDPDSLLLKEHGVGNWITAYIKLPEEYDVKDIDVASVTLDVLGHHVLVSKYNIQGEVLMVKFDRALVISFLWSMIEHMSPRVKQEVTLKVTGNLYEGDAFEGSDTIRVFFTKL